ncbi:MAG TPA: inositol monophosphatase family protein, partial [Microthrixaceae bacterium]|nr:inositol monophosphatase family protein [Microthrixaceae bacterium]
SERLIRATIAASRPADVIVGEENEVIPGASPTALSSDVVATWYVDPIDGTTNYVYDHPGYNVSIAAEIDGQVVAAVVADPTHGRMYSGTLGGGSFCNDRRLRIPSLDGSAAGHDETAAHELLAQALVATGFGYSSERRARQGRVVAELLPQIRDIRRMGAAALDLCSVASGRVDAYFEVGLGIWDLAAGQLIATEAGATVGPIEGGPDRPGSVLAARAELFEPLQELLSSLGAGQV